jgi:ribosome biogenesis GTPase A
LQAEYPGVIAERYGVTEQENVLDTLYEIAKARHCLLKGNEYDIDKAAGILLDEFRNGKLGKITLEKPENSIN